MLAPLDRLAPAVFAAALAGLSLAGPSARAAPRPAVHAVRASGPIRVDGVLDEPDWRRADPITDFRLMYAREGEVPSESTVVKVVREERRIVFGIVCQSARPPHAGLAARDQCLDDDHIALHIDTDGDGQRAAIFGVNPYGVQVDGVLTDDPDFSWDGEWEAETRRYPGGWSAEIAIPYRTLRFRAATGRPWRLWIRRQLTSRNEIASWPLWRQGEAGRIMLQAGELTGVDGVHGGRSLYVEPYVFGSVDGSRAFVPGVAPAWSDTRRRAAGVDAQAGVGSAMSLNATWNPDFSQIESDALKLDLNQRFPLQYPEKRPFFLEGADVFQTPLDMVYTRRMADPRWGAKLTGRAGATRTGVLLLRDEGGASLAGSGDGGEDDSRPGLVGLLRAVRELGGGNSLGLLALARGQDAPPGAAVPAGGGASWNGSRNTLVSGDAAVRFSDRLSWRGQAGWSETREDSLAAGSPGARDRHRDGGIWVSRFFYSDRTRNVFLGTRGVEPHYRDELGYQERTGVRYQNLITAWNLDRGSGALQRIVLNTNTLVIHGRANGIEYSEIHPWVEFQSRSNVTFALGAHVIDERWLARMYHQEQAHVSFSDQRERRLAWGIESILGDGVYYGDDDAASFLAWTETTTLTATLRPEARFSAALSVQDLRVKRSFGGTQVVGQTLPGLRLTAQFSRALSARVYPQYDSSTRHLDVNALLGWVEHPGTAFYAGVNGGFDPVPGLPRSRATSRQLFAKASWRFGI